MVPPPFQSKQPNLSWWKTLWKLSIPPKIRIFMWWASLDLLPTASNLLSHHVPVDGNCFLCKFHCASTSHCIFFCPVVRDAWKTTPFWYFLKSYRDASFLEYVLYASKLFNLEDLELFVIFCGAIWYEVCKRKQEGVRHNDAFRLEWVYELVDNNMRNSKLVNVTVGREIQQSVNLSWQPPLLHQFRFDVDAGFYHSSNRFSIGAVVRDFKGMICRVHAYAIRHPGTVHGVDLFAINVEWTYV